MTVIRKLVELGSEELEALQAFLREREQDLLPYHDLGFARVVDEVFGYENESLVAFSGQGRVRGYVPQWRRGKRLESVPWRDKGGPVADNDQALEALVKASKEIVRTKGLRGLVWRHAAVPGLEHSRYMVNVTVNLESHTPETFFQALSGKTRGKVRQAEKKGLVFAEENNLDPEPLAAFYRLFLAHRKRLGVPVYPLRLFKALFAQMDPQRVRLFSVSRGGEIVSSLILLCTRDLAVDAYSASHPKAFGLKANDFMIYRVLAHCMEQGIKKFDFGADSPLQESLIQYKMKWLGEKSRVCVSHLGSFAETDHNRPVYHFPRAMISRLPRPLYRLASRMIIR